MKPFNTKDCLLGITHYTSYIFPFILFLLYSIFSANAQIIFQKTYGGLGRDIATDVKQTSDGGYITVGYTLDLGDSLPEVCLLKTDSNGNTIWYKKYGGTKGFSMNDIYSVTIATDGGYVITGTTSSSFAVDSTLISYTGYKYSSSIFVMKTDANGNKLWAKSYGGYYSRIGRCNSIKKTLDGGYIVTGTTWDTLGLAGNYGSNKGAKAYLLKLDSKGDTLWTKGYYNLGGSSNMNSVCQTSDSGYAFVGALSNYLNNQKWNTYLIRTNSTGDTLWTKIYVAGAGPGTGFMYGGNDIQQTTDGGFIITGTIRPFDSATGNDCFLLKTDAQGKTMWFKSFGGSYTDYGNSVQQTSDGGYVMTGSLNAPVWLDELYVVKTNSAGTIQWSKSYGGIGVRAVGFSIQKTTDSGYIIAGSNDNGSGMSTGKWNYELFLIKMDGAGNSGCTFNETKRYDVSIAQVDTEYSAGKILTGGKYITIAPPITAFPVIKRRLCNPCSLITSVKKTDASCKNGAINLTVTGGTLPYVYNWSNKDTTKDISNLSPGTYLYEVSDSAGCFKFDSVIIVQKGSFNVIITKDTVICKGDSVKLTASGGIKYSWNTGNAKDTTAFIVVNPSVTTTYTVTVSDSSCTKSDSVKVTVKSVVASISGKSTCSCGSDTTTLTASGGTSYLWNTGATTNVITAKAGTASVIVFDGLCLDTTEVSVLVRPIFTTSIIRDTVICSGKSVKLIALSTCGLPVWSTGDTTDTIIVNPLVTTSYSVLPDYNRQGSHPCPLIDPAPCLDTVGARVTVTVTPSPIADAGKDTTVCAGNSVALNASGGTIYAWTPVIGLSNPSISNPTATPVSTINYFVTVANGSCSDTDSVTISVKPLPVFTHSSDVIITDGDTVTLTATATGAVKYLWSTQNTNTAVKVNPSATTIYYITVTDSNNCSLTEPITVTVKVKDCVPFVPNVFSPNEDGENDKFFVYGKCIKELHLSIYNRWGEKIFETTDVANGWDGTYKGMALNTGVFVYYLNATLFNNESFTQKGNVVLVR